MSALHTCKWCKKKILSPMHDYTVRKNGVLEHYHKQDLLHKDCFRDKIEALHTARQLLKDE